MCGKLLFKGLLIACTVEIKCKRCEKISSFGLDFSGGSYPLLNDAPAHEKLHASLKNGVLYEIKPHVFLLRDGSPTKYYIFDILN